MKGYTKEYHRESCRLARELKVCPFCGLWPDWLISRSVMCSNPVCTIYKIPFTFKKWMERFPENS